MAPAKQAQKQAQKKSTFNDTVFNETVKKELRHYHLYTSYQLTPIMMQNVMVSKKPTGDPESKGGREQLDQDYLQFISRRKNPPKSSYPAPITTSQQYGWDTQVLLKKDPRFNYPRVQSEITKSYGTK